MSAQMVPCRFCGTTTTVDEGATFSKCDNCHTLGGPQVPLAEWVAQGRDSRDWFIGHGFNPAVDFEMPHRHGNDDLIREIEHLRTQLESAKTELRTSQHEQQVSLTVDMGSHLSHLFKRLFPKDGGDSVDEKLDALLRGQEKIMAEIDDLQAALDNQGAAIGSFTTTLDTAVNSINTEIQQLASAVQSATDLAALKTLVAASVPRVTGFTDSISSASATLQAQVDALNADDPVVSQNKRR